MSGKLRMVHMGIEGRLELLSDGPERFRVHTDLAPFITADSGYDRGLAASASSVSPYRELTGRLRDFTRVDHPAESFGDWHARFDSVRVLRADEREGRKLWVVQLRSGKDISITAWVDAKTGDTLREELLEPMPEGPGQMAKSRSYSDFRDFEGLRVPYRSTAEDEFTGRAEFELESVEAHLKLPDDAFRISKD